MEGTPIPRSALIVHTPARNGPTHLVPTIDIYLEHRSGREDWHWTTHPVGAMAEFAYTRDELLGVLRTYGVWSSRLLMGAHLRLTVRGRFSGRLLAQAQWLACEPHGEPIIHWPAWERLCLSAQLHIPRYSEHDDVPLIDTGQTDVREIRARFAP